MGLWTQNSHLDYAYHELRQVCRVGRSERLALNA